MAAPVASADPRLTPARPDLAAASLAGRVVADRFVEGRLFQVRDAALPVRRAPAGDAPLDTEALYGERVTVYEEHEGWAWGQLARDAYVGYLPYDGLSPAVSDATHRVAALRTFVYPGPSIKLPFTTALSLGTRVAVREMRGDFAVTHEGGFLWATHLEPVGTLASDFVAVAERFVGVPYLWGGRTSLGTDCSGLMQTALDAAGVAAPRDSDLQERSLGTPVDPDGERRRGDLVFWKGHVGVLRDPDTLLHSSGYHMAVVSEPFGPACVRILAAGEAVRVVKRL